MNVDSEVDLTQAEYYMQECFELAKLSLGRTSPNPAIGAIVLDKNGVPVGKGYHKKAGTEHAEVIALNEAGEKAKGGTLIVNLEPCCHVGKTPPCTDLIIQKKIQEVIFSNYDPNPLVNKKGEKQLLDNNIRVVSKVLEPEGFELNKFFFKWIKVKQPWVTLKQAQTLDGRVALKNKQSKWITGELSRREVHNLRNIFDAVLVGASTVVNDNPELTVRDVPDSRAPIKIILDADLIIDPNANVYKNSSPVILATRNNAAKDKLTRYLKVNEKIKVVGLQETLKGKLDLKMLFTELAKMEILSVLIEAGPKLGGELVSNKLIDEYVLFISPKVFGDDAMPSLKTKVIESIDESFNFQFFNYKVIGNDLMICLRPKDF